jgi:hypothetical protein
VTAKVLLEARQAAVARRGSLFQLVAALSDDKSSGASPNDGLRRPTAQNRLTAACKGIVGTLSDT